ncbi:hypothetical protein FOL47_009704 [Perkinsus chesapeaki]|uniref:Uncharacterized protein n=1 Tax=Perkinsus chesapeaki TaxID=330153 RepID=A0A7J6L6U1_PERCH|nr:hypothetical protein FOL47_009704 [Perkinsus chesapeaki]
MLGTGIKLHAWTGLSFPDYRDTGPDWFVSHTWSSRFYEKVGVLILRFTSGLPFVIASLLSLVCRYYLSFPPALCVLLSWVFLVTGLLLEVFICFNGRTVFFDRFCIHQSNPVLLEQGIGHIDHAVRSCKNLGIMWSRDYFKRLWCVYEAGLFLDTHPLEKVEIWPQCFVTYVMFWGSISSLHWSLQFVAPSNFWYILYFTVAVVFTSIEDYPNRTAFAEDFSSASSPLALECSRESDAAVITNKVASKHGSVEKLCSSLRSTFGVDHVSRRLLLAVLFVIAYPTVLAVVLGDNPWVFIIEVCGRIFVHLVCYVLPKLKHSLSSSLCFTFFILCGLLGAIILLSSVPLAISLAVLAYLLSRYMVACSGRC